MNSSPEHKNTAQRLTECRVCNRPLFDKPLLQYKNMPKSAQYLPHAGNIADDCGIALDICQCSGCGLVQLNTQPVPYYREVIRASAVSEEMKNFRLRQFMDFAGRFSLQHKKIIEIGCGCGEYLSLMKQFVGEAYGLENAELSVQHCLSQGLVVSQGFIEDENTRLAHAPFDAFFILNFLEHLPDPNATLRGIFNNLTDGAAGLVEVPNFDMILGKNLFAEFISDHLFYFTKETLHTTLILNGFEIIDCKNVWHEYIISAVVRKRGKLNISYFSHHQDQLKKEIATYVDRFTDNKVAVWGAGHQALAILSLIDLANKIRYVIDSADFKQGKYTPATHVPIVSPETLESDPVEAVIVMAASYSDEVAGIIRQKYGRKVHVSILRDFGLEEI